jgi:hypothetical protein
VRRYPVNPAISNEGTPVRHAYRTVSGYEMDDRKLLMRGGIYDGQSWTGVVAVGKRVFCGRDEPWSPAGVYIVTGEIQYDSAGEPANIAVPAFA